MLFISIIYFFKVETEINIDLSYLAIIDMLDKIPQIVIWVCSFVIKITLFILIGINCQYCYLGTLEMFSVFCTVLIGIKIRNEYTVWNIEKCDIELEKYISMWIFYNLKDVLFYKYATK